MKARTSLSPIKALSYRFTFGKHKGESVQDVIDYDASYICWLAEHHVCFIPKWLYQHAEEIERYQSEARSFILGESIWDYIADD